MTLLEVSDLHVSFGRVKAVAGVDFNLPRGPYGLGLVGESGSGKTTIARAVLRLAPVVKGTITFEDRDVLRLRGRSLTEFRRTVQAVFQDADTALDPRMRLGSAIGEVLRTHRVVPHSAIAGRVEDLLVEVGLQPTHATRYPHQASGGERQRAAIARALAVEPRLLILDEPTSALDVTAQARILALIEELRIQRQLSYLLVSHNLAIVERLCPEIAVLYLGRVVERGRTDKVLGRPAHPYTIALLAAVPRLDARSGYQRLILPGAPADAANLPSGCAYHPRCPVAIDRCRTEMPFLVSIEHDHMSACHRAEEVLAGKVDLSVVESRAGEAPKTHGAATAVSESASDVLAHSDQVSSPEQRESGVGRLSRRRLFDLGFSNSRRHQ